MAFLMVGIAVALAGATHTVIWRKRWRNIGIAILAILWIASTPIVGSYLLRPLESSYSQLREFPRDCDTIVVLAGSVLPHSGGPVESLGDPSMRRCLEALRLYRQRPMSVVLLSGGAVSVDGSSVIAADAMNDFLVMLGLDQQHIERETQSANTRENSVLAVRLLRARGVKNIVLVTDAAHMARAATCFERRGVHVTPAPCNFQATWPPSSWRSLVPSVSGLLKTQYACHEYLGAAWYWLIDSSQTAAERISAAQ